jgi:predicted transcriptional regulator
MDLSRPHSSIAPSRDLDVLKVLAGTTRPLTGRGVARLIGKPASSVQPALDRLVGQGLVHREPAGAAYMFALNREHLAAPAVEVLAEMRPELLRRLRQAVGQWESPPAHASLFGSAARGNGGVDSDVDIFLVRPAAIDSDDERWREQVTGLEIAVRQWTGNEASVVEVAEPEIRRASVDGSPLLKEVRRDAIDPEAPPRATISGRGDRRAGNQEDEALRSGSGRCSAE